MKITDIPPKVYMQAIENEGFTPPEDLRLAGDWYRIDAEKQGFTTGGLEKAIADYLTRSGSFNQDDDWGWEFS